jgi:hypothetical protein
VIYPSLCIVLEECVIIVNNVFRCIQLRLKSTDIEIGFISNLTFLSILNWYSSLVIRTFSAVCKCPHFIITLHKQAT